MDWNAELEALVRENPEDDSTARTADGAVDHPGLAG